MAIWSPNLLSELIIEIHPKDIKGSLVLPRDWVFKKTASFYSASLKNIKPAKIKPLIFAVNQKMYRQYKVHTVMNSHTDSRWYIKSNDMLPDKNNSYSPEMMVDQNLKTAWCSNKVQSKFIFKIEANKSREGYCYLEGIGFINGYTKSPNLFKANRRVKRGSIKINGDPEEYFDFNDTFISEEYEAYNIISYIKLEKHSLTNDKEITMEIEILETYTGTKYEDVCITEIFPAYNCP